MVENDHSVAVRMVAPRHPAACETVPMRIAFESELRSWEARRFDTWLYVELPQRDADEIRERVEGTPRRGFSSLRVRATVGDSVWATSIFAREGRYTLSIKRPVREAQGLAEGDRVAVALELLDL
jgi:hypothetical protein